MTTGLTKRQSDCLAFIRSSMVMDGFSPSVDEIREFLGLASKSGVHRLLKGLRERGYINWLPDRARSIYFTTDNGVHPFWECKISRLCECTGMVRSEVIQRAVESYFSRLERRP